METAETVHKMTATDTIQQINADNANNVLLVDGKTGRKFTYAEVQKDSCKIAGALAKKGIKKGDRIVFSLQNSMDFARLYFACLYSGVVAVPINPLLSQDQKQYIINSCKAKLVIISDQTISGFRAENLLKGDVTYVLLGNDGKLVDHNKKATYIDLNDLQKETEFKPFSNSTDKDDLVIIYTSGTTSDPKGVVHSLSSLVTSASLFNTAHGITSENRFYNNLPMTYLGGYYNLLLLPFVGGSSVVIGDTFNPEAIIDFWNPVIKNQVNTLWLVPTVISILNSFDRSNVGVDYCKSNVKIVFTGTAPLYENIRNAFEKKYGLRLIENFGLSETLFITTETLSTKRVTGSAGKLIKGMKVRIIDRSNQEAGVKEEGEIQVKTPTLMKGYYHPEDNSYSLPLENGWFATGDIGYMNETGDLFITGRKKDLIIRGGINISPAAIEDVIYSHKGVQECAVVGIPNKFTGEDIVAVIKVHEGVDFETLAKELNEICKTRLSSIQVPNKFLELSDFPKTSANKIQKNRIRSWVEEKFSSTSTAVKKDTRGNPDFFKASNVVGNSIQAVSIRYNNTVYEMQQKGIDVTVMSLGEAFFDIPLYPFDDLPMPALYHYTHSRGILELRKNLLQYFQEHFEFGFDPEKEIIVTAGSKIAIHMALMAILNPGDEAIIHEPAWVSYPEQIKLCYGVPVQIPYYEDVFSFEKYITNRTKVIIINSPNNPSGKVFSVEELTHLNNLAKKYNLFILSDEAYSDFLLKGEQFISLGNLDREFTHSIVVNSISKNYGISGWRLGYIISNQKVINEILKINQHLITCPPTILQYYISKHFKEIIKITKPQILAVVEKRQQVLEYLLSKGLTALQGSATFYLFVSIAPSKLSSEEFCTNLLEKEHICVVPGIGYGKTCDKFVRVSIGTESIDRIKSGIDKIANLIKATS